MLTLVCIIHDESTLMLVLLIPRLPFLNANPYPKGFSARLLGWVGP